VAHSRAVAFASEQAGSHPAYQAWLSVWRAAAMTERTFCGTGRIQLLLHDCSATRAHAAGMSDKRSMRYRFSAHRCGLTRAGFRTNPHVLLSYPVVIVIN
jgi:hypothetical protein